MVCGPGKRHRLDKTVRRKRRGSSLPPAATGARLRCLETHGVAQRTKRKAEISAFYPTWKESEWWGFTLSPHTHSHCCVYPRGLAFLLEHRRSPPAAGGFGSYALRGCQSRSK